MSRCAYSGVTCNRGEMPESMVSDDGTQTIYWCPSGGVFTPHGVTLVCLWPECLTTGLRPISHTIALPLADDMRPTGHLHVKGGSQ